MNRPTEKFVCVRTCVYVFVCVCVLCVRTRLLVCVCVCVCCVCGDLRWSVQVRPLFLRVG